MTDDEHIGGPDPMLAHQAFVADLNRVLCDELDLVQLSTIGQVLTDIASTYDPNLVRAKAASYDGVFRGIHAMRTRIEEPGLGASDAEQTMWSHPNDRPRGVCTRCGYGDELGKAHARWAAGERGTGPDGV